ncbi:MAG: glycosyltransferase family 2 protein [Thermoleophilaceae bacterium]
MLLPHDDSGLAGEGTAAPEGALTLAIATKGRPEIVAETLESLARCSPLPHELIVVDGDEAGSARPAVEAFAEARPAMGVHYVASEPGLTRQRNRAIERAEGEAVVFVDDDVHFDPSLFAVLEEAYRDPALVGATGQIIEESHHRIGGERSAVRRLLHLGAAEGTMTPFGYPRRVRDLGVERDVEFMKGCFMSARRGAAERVRFDERLTGYALAEDEDFSYRLSRLGRLRFLPRAVVHHRNTGFRSFGSREFNRIVVRNRAYLFRKNFPQSPLARVQFGGFIALLVLHRALNREWAGVHGLLEGAVAAWRRRAASP